MKNWLPTLSSMLFASAVLAEPPAAAPTWTEQTSALVEQKLLQPLRKAEFKRSAFSRAAPPPTARRVRVLDATPEIDAQGERFVRFAVDARYAWTENAFWRRDVFVGCAYLEQHQVFVKRGEDYFPAISALGANPDPTPDVCRAAPSESAKTASAAQSSRRIDASSRATVRAVLGSDRLRAWPDRSVVARSPWLAPARHT